MESQAAHQASAAEMPGTAVLAPIRILVRQYTTTVNETFAEVPTVSRVSTKIELASPDLWTQPIWPIAPNEVPLPKEHIGAGSAVP
jgi:hypothetical protein